MGSLPQKLGRYPIVGLLATGGMAEILLGKVIGAAGFERPVVVKRVLPHLARQKSFIDMFIDEARVVANIRHPNVVDVHEFGRDGDELFLVMEYLEGESAASLMRHLTKQHRPLGYALAAHIVAEACAGLHNAHELTGPDGTPQNLVHRDLSPHNVFLTYQGQVKVIDFGVALTEDRLARTSAGHVKGKFGYMSPEQCMSKPLDRRSDIFALGIVLFELTTGQRLFKAKNELLTLQAVFQDPIPKPTELVEDYPASLENVVLRALSRTPEERQATAAEMRAELTRALQELPVEGAPSDALSNLMSEVFARRKTRKKEMLQRVAAGWSFDSLPQDVMDPSEGGGSAENDGSDDWAAGAPSWASQSKGSVARPVAASMAPQAAARRRRSWLLAGAGAALVAGGAAAILSRGGQDQPPALPPPVTTSSAEHPPLTPPPVAPTASVAVTITVATTPPGAQVSLAGDDQGATPVSFTVPRGETALQLTIALAGHETITEAVVPTSDARLKLTLQRATGSPTRGQPVPTAQPSARGFRRFD